MGQSQGPTGLRQVNRDTDEPMITRQMVGNDHHRIGIVGHVPVRHLRTRQDKYGNSGGLRHNIQVGA